MRGCPVALAIAMAAACCTPSFAAHTMTVKEFLSAGATSRSANDDACSAVLLDATIDANAASPENSCSGGPSPEEEFPAIAAWLRSHDRVHPDDASAATAEAIKALYCRHTQ